jgi:predicted SPOUT superfamily RNA methylase MTH1
MAAPRKHPFHYAIAVPASFVSDIPHMREKTFRIGLIGRAAAMFRVNEVIIYPDMPNENQREDIRLVQAVLSYMETPQYLRRRLFKIVPELQYAGTLPPLRTPHHPTANKTSDLRQGEFREGAVISASNEGSLIDIGVEQPALLRGVQLKANSRITARISVVSKRPEVTLADPRDNETYWGYKVTASNAPFGQFLKARQFDLVIATSKRGRLIKEGMNDLANRFRTSHNILTAFGAPSQGLHEIVGHEQAKLDDMADFVINTIPGQATETVRTEEAVYASLSILNTLSNTS